MNCEATPAACAAQQMPVLSPATGERSAHRHRQVGDRMSDSELTVKQARLLYSTHEYMRTAANMALLELRRGETDRAADLMDELRRAGESYIVRVSDE